MEALSSLGYNKTMLIKFILFLAIPVLMIVGIIMFINYVFEKKIADSVISIIHVKNLRSQRVAEKNGLKIEKQILWNDLDVYIFRITAADFNKQF